MVVDYIIVGLGLAGIAFCEKLEQNNKSFVVFDAGKNTSSTVAGGLYNPVILKRFTPVWNALGQIETALPFYERLASKLHIKLNYKTSVYRVFSSVEEQNLWFEASDKPVLEHFLFPEVHVNKNKNIHAPYGFGKVLQSGRIDTALLLASYRAYLRLKRQLVAEQFQHDKLKHQGKLVYENIKANHIVFAEGFGMKNNLFFDFLPLVGNKGELLTIKAPQLKLEVIIKSSVFIIPLGNDLYRVGATYHWTDKTTVPTGEAKRELVEKLNKVIKCPYEVVRHDAGMRPTVIDRKPLVGTHLEIKNMYVLNGMGTHGVLIAPQVAMQLYDCIENGIPLDKETDIQRFK